MKNPEDINQPSELDIAIIGMSGRFPQAQNLEKYWQNLRDGVESISFFSEQELRNEGVEESDLSQPNYVKASAVLEDAELFDASFFDYSPRVAEIMDPQHRLFLESAWDAIENAGYNSETYPGEISIYGGASISSYFLFNLFCNTKLLKLVGFDQIRHNNRTDNLTTRVAYKLNLRGTAITIQTGCSSSLVALHLACQSLLDHECDMALAGGVSISALQKTGYVYQEGGILSPDGHCRAFDAKAQGTVNGNGVAIVVLKRLIDAIADRDCIHAVIKGSAINNDGSAKVGYTAPSVEGQAKVIAEALAMARIEPDMVSYIETHGTGTVLGDPIEIAALTKSFHPSTNKQKFCAIGSVKTNIGHLDTASGIAGLIKTVLALKHKQIPPSLHFQQPNPQIDFANSPFYVNNTLAEWKSNGNPRRAGVSSFGIGGTNAHAILEEAPTIEASSASRQWQLLVLSAKTKSALETATVNLFQHFQHHPQLNLADAAYTLQVGRQEFNHRRVIVCQNLNDAVQALETTDTQPSCTNFTELCEQQTVFMYPGQGTQYVGMGQDLYQTEPIFRQQVDYCCELLKPHLGLDLRTVLYPQEQQTAAAAQQLKQTYITQPALFVIEYALAKLWIDWGLHPKAMIGHSIGEYVAACLAGVFSLEDALVLVASRGRLMQQLPAGEMLAVPLPEKEVQSLLGEKLSLAASNAPDRCVVSGPKSAIDDLQNHLTKQGIDCRPLHTSHAFHSQMMNSIIEPFTQQLEKVNFNSPKIPFLSNVTGTWITASESTNPSYWSQHLCQTVRFGEGIAELLKEPNQIFLEVGPGRTLSTLTRQQAKGQLVFCSLRHPQEQKSDLAFLLNTLGQLWLNGIKLDWSGFYANERRHRIPLPTYPFERQRYWIEPQKPTSDAVQFQPQSTASELWKSLVNACHKQDRAGIKELDEQTYLANKQCLDSLCAAYMNQALRRLGTFSKADEKYSLEQLFEQGQIIPRYQQLLHRWMQVLVEQGQLQQDAGSFANLLPVSTDSINALLQEAKVRFADASRLVNLVEKCGENLAAVLTGEKEPLELHVAVQNKGITKVDSPLYNHCKKIIRASLEDVVKSLSPKVNLRILEIGGGTGIATAELLPVLPLEQTNYTFTDVGGWFLKQAQQKFSVYPFVEYRFLDIQEPPTQQGYSSHSFDVVVAINVLHTTRNIGETLQHVRSLLAPGGFLLLWEITQAQPEFDVTGGLLMNLLADEERSKGNPFLSKEQWDTALRSSGFVSVVTLSETEAFGHHVFAAQASGSVEKKTPVAFTATLEQKDLWRKKPEILPEELVQENQSQPTRSSPDLGKAYVAPRNEIEFTLGKIWQELLGNQQVSIHDNFFELGGDSLFATMLVSRLCKTFEVELPYQSFFETPTVAELAEAIVQRLAQQTDEKILAQALAEIQELSDEEVQTILTSQEQLIEVGEA
ncbi:type I polyketide synthase [Cylindrospermum sp. FACHB-282]|uniref:type I polyketide synthase n=1 Tax=Cylindrospermum sp. FACHB-282 TaxID=2692794 RepID=UPI001688D2B6|nr:type I polyketide synthase [Cylindrospermum sp. FACHB-282]MBD2385753.1 acyltransferase domain-containing protein [Cylindrospermum sp. FACHB-282]